jgi:hypothetical protein
MIETGVKQLAMSKIQSKIDSGEVDVRVGVADWTDPFFQVEAIKQFFVGKKDILNAFNSEPKTADVVADDLDLNDKPAARPRKEV